MNKDRWKASLPIAVLALKLSEEAAEVGTLVTDSWMADSDIDITRMNEELDHVELLAGAIRTKVNYRV